MDDRGWLDEISTLFGAEADRGEGFELDFADYVEQESGGWGEPGKCDLCGKPDVPITKKDRYCFSCTKYVFGLFEGECKGLIILGRHLWEGFEPVRELLEMKRAIK